MSCSVLVSDISLASGLRAGGLTLCVDSQSRAEGLAQEVFKPHLKQPVHMC